MTALPPALAGWGPELAELPEDVVLALEPWLVRLSAALGPLDHQPQRGRGTPDGFDGLTRRGNYERLLASEWLLAERHPLEFLRRAANAEHLFYALAEQSTTARRRLVVLFDAGPEQLGAPRIAHLALLLTMAARARAARVDLLWGVLQAAPAALVPDVSPQSVLRLLRGRSRLRPDPGMLEARLQALPGPPVREDEIWLVGGPLEHLGNERHRRARVTEPLGLGDRTLEITLGGPRGRAKTIGPLPIPAGPVAVRLLRNPFEAAPPPARAQVAATTFVGPRFSADGRAVMVRTATGVLVQRLPKRGGAVPLPRHLSTESQPPIAAGRFGRTYQVLVAAPSHLAMMQFSRQGRFTYAHRLRPGEEDAVAPAEGHALAPLLSLGGNRRPELVTVDALGRALAVPRDGVNPPRLLCEGVRGLARVSGSTVLVVERDEDRDGAKGELGLRGAHGRPLRAQDLPRRAVIWLDVEGHVQRVLTLPLGDGDYRAEFSATAVAVRFDPDRWFVVDGREDVIVEAGVRRVIGCYGRRRAGAKGLGLVVLGRDEPSLEAIEPAGNKAALGKLTFPPGAATLSPDGETVAYLTPEGALRAETLLGELVFETHPEAR